MNSIQISCCTSTLNFFSAPFKEGKLRILEAFKPAQETPPKSVLHRIGLIFSGLCLFIPLINTIIFLAMKRFSSHPIKPNLNSITQPGTLCDPSTPTVVVPIVGLPNFGKPKLNNICWMNAGCQVIFRSPLLVNKLVEAGELPNPSRLIVALNALLKLLQARADESQIREIQEQLIDCIAERDEPLQSKIGQQHSPACFLQCVIADLHLNMSLTTTLLKSQQPILLTEEKQADYRMLVAGYKKGKSYDQIITGMAILAEIPLNSGEKFPIKNLFNKIPAVILIHFNNFQNRTCTTIPETLDFSNLFNDKIRAQHKEIKYKLQTGAQHSNPAYGKAGHYMAQQQIDRFHYDDRYVSKVLPTKLLDNLLDSPIHVWEIEDPTLVTK